MSKRGRFFIIILLCVLAGFALYPTIQWYFLLDGKEKAIVSGTRVGIRDVARQQARSDINGLLRSAKENTTDVLPKELEYTEKIAEENYKKEGEKLPDAWTSELVLQSFTSKKEAYDTLENYYFKQIDKKKKTKSRIIQLGLDLFGGVQVILRPDIVSLKKRLGHEPSKTELSDALDVAMEVLRSRIDVFGVTEPRVGRYENNQIIIEVPGDNDPDRINSFLSGKSSLYFVLVDDDTTTRLIEEVKQNPAWNPETDGVPDYVPAGTTIAPYITKDRYGIDKRVRWIAIKEDISESGLDGKYIVGARLGQDPFTGRPLVNFELSSDGSERFARLTRNNIDSSLAIVLDNKVRAYAVIQTEIGDGQGSIRGFSQQEAHNIVLVLRTAALPVNLLVSSQQSVGALLGRDTVMAGLKAIGLGFLLVMLFMLVYYRGAGLIADIALLLNLFFIFSILSVFNLTLTLTSIAGLVLTVGMSVDANVIIFERMREEYRLGKSPRAIVEGSYRKAFWTIMDANITTFIAALLLSQFGTGPVQGFAVTLAVGIISSMFSALFFSRLIFDFGVETLRWSRFKVGWGLK